MARIDALSVFQTAASPTKAKLAEIYGEIIENVRKNTISSQLKNTRLSGDFAAGSVEANRIEMTDSKPYGTARAAGKADKATIKPVPVQFANHRELLKEFEKFDIEKIGIVSLMQREATNLQFSMELELETAFFTQAVTDGTAVVPVATETIKKIDEVILAIETTKNAWVKGVPRPLMHVICRPGIYQEIRDFIDTISNTNVDTTIEEFGKRHGVTYWSSVFLPAGIDFIVMVRESIAQPVRTSQYDGGGIPLSDATAEGFFFNYGCAAVMPDLIKYVSTPVVIP